MEQKRPLPLLLDDDGGFADAMVAGGLFRFCFL